MWLEAKISLNKNIINYIYIYIYIYLIKKYLIDPENSALHHMNKFYFKVY